MEDLKNFNLTLVLGKSTSYHDAINPTFTVSNVNVKGDVKTADYEFIALLYDENKSKNLEDCIVIHEKGKVNINDIINFFKEHLDLDVETSQEKLLFLAIYRKTFYILYKTNEKLRENKFFFRRDVGFLKNSILTDSDLDAGWNIYKKDNIFNIIPQYNKNDTKYISHIIWGEYPFFDYYGNAYEGHEAALHAAKARAAIRYLKKIK